MSRSKNGRATTVRESDTVILENAEAALAVEQTPEPAPEREAPVVEPENLAESAWQAHALNMGSAFQALNVEPPYVPESGELVVAADGRGVHRVVRVKGELFSAICGRAYKIGGPADPLRDIIRACAYCMDDNIAPLDATDDKPVKVKAPKVARILSFEEQIAAEQELATTRRATISDAFRNLSASFNEMPEWPETGAVIEILETALRAVKSTRSRSASGSTGPKASRAVYSVTPTVASDTPELAQIREYANTGDSRAQAIIAHVDAWVDADGKAVSTKDKLATGVCSFCESDKHLRRTGFFSAAREIEKMAERANKGQSEAAA